MPDQTPNFAIPYPCPGDVIDCDMFADWANAIDDALTTVNTAAEAAANRPRAMLRTLATGFAVPVNVATTIQFNEVTNNPVYNNGITVGAFPYTGFTVNPPLTSGFYLFSATFIPVNTVTTVTAFKASIVADNVSAGRTTASSVVGNSASPLTVTHLGVMQNTGLVPPATCVYQWNGTGGPMNVYVQFSCQYVSVF